jgi:tetraacyldisaccharide 4'-kinase
MSSGEIAPGPALQALLFLPGAAYAGLVRLRNRLYDAGLLPVLRLPCPAVALGNLTVGGTGKTPMTSFLAAALREAGFRVGVLSRGYGRAEGREPCLVSDGRRLLADAATAGDEPYLIARDNPAAAVAVGADRAAAAALLLASHPEVFLLDDAFQHRRIARDVNLLLVDGRDPFGNGRMLPRGPLREPLPGVARADAVVVTRGGGRCPDLLRPVLERYNPQAPVFHASIVPRRFVRPDGEPVDLPGLKGFSAYAFSGIARPRGFEEDLGAVGLRIAGARRFPDHHRYRRQDLAEVAAAARSSGAEVLVTTEKDLVRMTALPEGGLPLVALALGVSFSGADLAAWLLDRLRAAGGVRS